MQLPNRKPARLNGYDYSNQNFYFITICTHEKSNLFGSANNLNECGTIAQVDLANIHNHFKGVKVDKYVVMPNHVHAIIVIGCEGAGSEWSRPFPTLSTIIGLYKSGVSKRIHEIEPDKKSSKNLSMTTLFAMSRVIKKYGNILTKTL